MMYQSTTHLIQKRSHEIRMSNEGMYSSLFSYLLFSKHYHCLFCLAALLQNWSECRISIAQLYLFTSCQRLDFLTHKLHESCWMRLFRQWIKRCPVKDLFQSAHLSIQNSQWHNFDIACTYQVDIEHSEWQQLEMIVDLTHRSWLSTVLKMCNHQATPINS